MPVPPEIAAAYPGISSLCFFFKQIAAPYFCTMRIRSFTSLALLFSSFLFSGCFEIYYDVVLNPGGSFTLRQTVGLSNEFFQGLTSAGAAVGDTTPISRQSVVDSIRHSLTHRRDSLVDAHAIIGLCGITSFNIRDTTMDAKTFFTLESTVTSADSLLGALRLMGTASKMMQPGASEEDSDDIQISASKKNGKLSFLFHAPQKEGGFMNVDIPGMSVLFKDLSLHYRLFAPSLEKPTDKHIKQIPGGQERVFGLNELTKKGRKNHLDAMFVLKNILASPN